MCNVGLLGFLPFSQQSLEGLWVVQIVRLLIFKMSMLQKRIPVEWYEKVTLVVQILIKVPHFPKGYICKTVKTKHSKKAEWRNVECKKKKKKNFLLKQEREVKNTACTETCVCTGFRSLPRVKCCTSKQHPPPPPPHHLETRHCGWYSTRPSSDHTLLFFPATLSLLLLLAPLNAPIPYLTFSRKKKYRGGKEKEKREEKGAMPPKVLLLHKY